MTIRYGSGPGYALVTPGAIAVLDGSAEASLVERLWAALGEPDPGPKALREMVSASGGDFDAMCPFALVLPADGAARVVVRGPLSVTVHSALGTEQLEGAHVVTWAERELSDVWDVTVTLGEPGADARLPIGFGVVRAGTVVVGVGARPAAPAPTPVVPEEEAPPPPAQPVAPPPPAQPVAPPPALEGPPASAPADDAPPPSSDRSGTVGEGTTWGPGVTLVDYVPLAPAATPVEPEHTYDDLFGPTRIHAVEEAAVRLVDEQAPPASPPQEVAPGDLDPDPDPDHDHRTVVGVRRRRPPAAEAPAGGTPAGPTVLGRRCDSGHENPPTRTACRVCGGPVSGALTQVARPPLGRMRFATGAVVELDAPVVLGRRPRVARVTGEQLPRVVTLPSPLGEISGSHLAVRLEEWLVLAVDLDSSNGTILLRPGAAPRRLTAQRPEILRSGDVLDLGDGAAITFEDLP